jgi:O-antigen/teichoic acid export membrane protein
MGTPGAMDSSSTTNNAVQSVRNIASNTALLVINILISFWYTPYLIHNLGSERFGFVPLTDSVIQFFSILTLSLNTATGRYLTIELEQRNQERANQIFNTTLVGTFLLIALASPIAIMLVILAPKIFHVPESYRPGVQILFVGTIAAFFLTTLRSNFSVATFAKNRFDLRNIVTLAARIGQILVIILLFQFYPPSLLHVSLGALAAGLLAYIGDFALWKKLLPVLKVNLKAFKKDRFKALMHTSIWMVIYQVGFMLFLNTDMVVANQTQSLKVAGMFGALVIIPKNLLILSRAGGGIWGPAFLSKYSLSDYQGLNQIVRYSLKIISFSLALPIGFLSGIAGPFLRLWLGTEYEAMAGIFVLMIFHLAVNLVTAPYFNVQVSYNKLAIPALVNLVTGIFHFILALILSRRIGVLGIVLAGASLQSLKNWIIIPIYTARVMGLTWWRYILALLPGALATLTVALASYGLAFIFPIQTLAGLVVLGGLVSVAYILVVYRVGLSGQEKEALGEIYQQFIHPLAHK